MKTILKIIRGVGRHWVGNGFPVRTLLSYQDDAEAISPFLLLDYAGPEDFPPHDKVRGVGPHPHRGFETVTIVYQGEVEHRDTAGNQGKIGPGDVQWMTAARGVLHEEMHSQAFTQKGGTLEVVQLWVNLPAKDKMSPPQYQEILKRDIPVVALDKTGSSVRVIAGHYGNAKGPAKTFTPVSLWDVRLKGGYKGLLTLQKGFTAALLMRRGWVRMNASETVVAPELALFSLAGSKIQIETEIDSELLLMGGKPIHEPVVGHGPFVMNTREEIGQALSDFQANCF